MKVQEKHGKVTQNMHGASRNYRYVWDVSGRARDPSGVPVVAPLRCLGDSGSFRCADFLYIFLGIFGALLMAGKPEIQKQQKTKTGNWVH